MILEHLFDVLPSLKCCVVVAKNESDCSDVFVTMVGLVTILSSPKMSNMILYRATRRSGAASRD
jgi:hypothetical protein